eukprot:scaffold585_cov237-Pinguiococcus_pyrenoidosus.AAC.15
MAKEAADWQTPEGTLVGEIAPVRGHFEFLEIQQATGFLGYMEAQKTGTATSLEHAENRKIEKHLAAIPPDVFGMSESGILETCLADRIG